MFCILVPVLNVALCRFVQPGLCTWFYVPGKSYLVYVLYTRNCPEQKGSCMIKTAYMYISFSL